MITLAPVWTESSQQMIYRRLLAALARPGTVAHFADLDLGVPAWMAVLACLCDDASTVADIDTLLSERDWGLLNAQFSAAPKAAFVLGDGQCAPINNSSFRIGTETDPEGGATVILRVTALIDTNLESDHYQLSGPGIATTRSLPVVGLDPSWVTLRQRLNDYPRGIDLVLADEQHCVCLPRTTSITSQPIRKH